ncbi:MAG: HYR domain-containing protein [Nitrospinales bacterium]
MKGNFIELGVHDSFSFGTEGAVPAAPEFHPKVKPGDAPGLGFVADQDQDGWDAGPEGWPTQTGDYFLPGIPEEGWGVEWTGSDGVERSFNNFGLNALAGDTSVPTTSLVDESDEVTNKATWLGTASAGGGSLEVKQTVSFDNDDLFFVVDVTLTNVGTTTLKSVEYMRSVDPDQEQPFAPNMDHITRNWVQFQSSRPAGGTRVLLLARKKGGEGRVLAMAKGRDHGIALGLGAIDDRAVAAASHGFANRDTDFILDDPNQPEQADKIEENKAIAIAFDLGSLDPGDSATFSYAYVVDKDDLVEAITGMGDVTILEPVGTAEGADVPFRAVTKDTPRTTQIEFFIDGASIGIDTTPDATGIFEVLFTTTDFAPVVGPHFLKATATFDDGGTADKIILAIFEDTTPPDVTPPPDITMEATGPTTAVALGSASAVDDVDGSLPAAPDSAGPFAVGVHTITWSATDASGNTGTAIQTVTITDTTPPDITAPGDLTVDTDPLTPGWIGVATASDVADPNPLITNDAPATFPFGTTIVTWTATDATGNSASDTQNVTIRFPLTISLDKAESKNGGLKVEGSFSSYPAGDGIDIATEKITIIVDGLPSFMPLFDPAKGKASFRNSTTKVEIKAGNRFKLEVKGTSLTPPVSLSIRIGNEFGSVVVTP